MRRTLRVVAFTAALLLFFPRGASWSEQINSHLLDSRWRAVWIACPEAPRREFGVCHLRKTFTLGTAPQHFVVHVSGDNRYELFVNGTRVVEGPARGDLDHWRFETLDIGPQLRSGRNVLAAVIWNFAELAPMAQMTNETGLVLQEDSQAESVVNTNATWKALENKAVSMIPPDPKKVQGYFVVGPGEAVDGARYPWGWQNPDFDDSAWKTAAVRSAAAPRAIQDSPSRWMFVPRTIPPMEEKPLRLERVVRSQGIEARQEFLEGKGPLTVPANTRATILFDQSYLTTAYPELTVSGGRGAEITLTYAEALFARGRLKGNRNDTTGKFIRGLQDKFIADGGTHHTFRPLWWRTYRYLQMDVVTQAEPLVLEDLLGAFSAYPFVERATFQSDDPELQKMWEVGWRTARLCAHETYMDCPYYEQLQYVGDTRIQALISLYDTGDDRLVKNAIESIDESRTPEGLTQSRYPSFLPQYIPPFSLFWIGMMRDLWWYHGDDDFLRQYLLGMRGVLAWFEKRLAASGLLGRLEWWDFVDWTRDFRDGVPPQAPDGQSAILSLQFARALQEAADLEEALGSKTHAEHDRALAARIAHAVYEHCWDASRGLLADTPAKKHFSQHANIFGVLAGAIPAADQKAVMEKVLADSTLTQCSYYFRFYLFRAMKKVGLGDEYLSQLGPWRHMLELGLTTWAETPEPTRSDCHAWSAHPNFDFLATVAGIEPAAAGFRSVAIEPHLGLLRHLSASMPVPQGSIRVEYRRDGEHLEADVELPAGLSGTFIWQGQKKPLAGGAQHLVF